MVHTKKTQVVKKGKFKNLKWKNGQYEKIPIFKIDNFCPCFPFFLKIIFAQNMQKGTDYDVLDFC